MDPERYKLISRVRTKLDKTDTTLLIYGENGLLYESDAQSLTSLMTLIDNGSLKDKTITVVGDQVIGKAAASLIIQLRPQSVIGLIVSVDAIELFEQHGVLITWMDAVPRLVDKTTRTIPELEKQVESVDDLADATQKIRNYLTRLDSVEK